MKPRVHKTKRKTKRKEKSGWAQDLTDLSLRLCDRGQVGFFSEPPHEGRTQVRHVGSSML